MSERRRNRSERPYQYHKPSEPQTRRIEVVRAAFQVLDDILQENVKSGSISGRYKSLAETALEEAAMWATKAIVFEEENAPQESFVVGDAPPK